MQQIINCRTAILGGHRQWCGRCGFQRYLYHSCRNRHCPKCQAVRHTEAWRAGPLAGTASSTVLSQSVYSAARTQWTDLVEREQSAIVVEAVV